MQTSGAVRFTVTVSSWAYDELVRRARLARRSLSAEAALLVEAGLGGEEPSGAGEAVTAVDRRDTGVAIASSSPPSPGLEEEAGQGSGVVAPPSRRAVPASSSSLPSDQGPRAAGSAASRKGLCVHRVPADQFCKRCDG